MDRFAVSQAPPVSEQLVLDAVRSLLAEVDPGRARTHIGLDDSLARDLGLGSLERVELIVRLEQASGVHLPENAVAEADTPRHILKALADASPSTAPETRGQESRSVGGGRASPTSTRTLTEALRWQVDNDSGRTHLFLREDTGRERQITFSELWHDASSVAAGLHDLGVAPGDRVALLLRTEHAFFRAYFGVLLAGAVPVPLYPPFRADQIEEYARRQAGILLNAEARVLLTFSEAERAAGLLRPFAPSLAHVKTVDGIARDPGRPILPSIDASQLALIQYTSGSTGSPKGVALAHANILANIRAFGEHFAIGPDDVAVTWLPLYHDMGLIGTWLGALYHGIPLTVMSPIAFLSRPARWLEALHAHRGTLSAAPNFAYDLCVRKVADDDLEGLDLSAWRCALNGAEAVHAGTLERFAARFGRSGFTREAFAPVYGLAEATLCVTAPPLGRPPRIDRIARTPFERARLVETASDDDPGALTFVACGRPIPSVDVRIVDVEGKPVGDREEGRIQFCGPSAMQGYFRNPTATAAVMSGDWVDTGDLGYRAEQDLFVTGRVKDVIIAGGRNIYPQEVEEAVAAVSGVRQGCVAALGVVDVETGTERLVVVAESRTPAREAREGIRAAILDRVVDAIGVPPDVIVVARPGSIPKTSSGKIRRSATRDAYLAGTLERGRASTALQWIRLVARNVWWRVGRLASLAGTTLFTVWIALWVPVVTSILWIAVALAPAGRPARRLVRIACRVLLALGGCRPHVEGLGSIAPDKPAVVVANHASFLDVVVLLAVLPPDVRFAAKARLTRYPILGTVIVKSEHVRVQRGSSAAVEEFNDVLRSGDSLFVFPEGTFVRARGVMPFRLGAFRVAVDGRWPVVPVSLAGTRRMWPDETWMLRPGRVSVRVGPRLEPSASGWPEMVRMRDEARTWIAARCDEPLVDRGPVLTDG
jgi:1-acyl-sn-glycerol-3-phosphate acyltransferase